jgi:phosphoribosyl 1,2-cyclic phosphate phosphodiesterase
MRVTVLGCGPSMGVPMITGGWGKCDPANPRNSRTRSSIMVEHRGKRILVDAGPDLRQQLLANGFDAIDALIITHEHADHTHGIDEVRGLALSPRPSVPLYATADVADSLKRRFNYLFGGGSIKRPWVVTHEVEPGTRIEALDVQTFEQDHFVCRTLGLRFGAFGYSTDVMSLDDAAFAALDGVDTWIVAALRHDNHEAHAPVSKVLTWIERLKPRRAILTHMSASLDYDELKQSLPPNVEPAYDGMVIDIDD